MMEMQSDSEKRLLILGDGFGPPGYNPRLRALCEGALRDGYGIDVVVEHIYDIPIHLSFPVDEVKLYSGGKLDWAVKNFLSLLFDWKDRAMSRYVEKHYGEVTYCGVICTAFHTFPLRAAIEFGRRHRIPVTLDIRDIVEQAPKNVKDYLRYRRKIPDMFVWIYNTINLDRRNRWLRSADKVTTVSPWHMETLKAFNPNTELIYNGYDREQFYPSDTQSDRFILTYAGKFYGEPLQNPTLLFEALKSLKDAIPFFVEIYTSGTGKSLLGAYMQKYGLSELVRIGDYIPNSEIPGLLHRSSIVLVFSNTAMDTTAHGMMTTKFFEALGVEKPVLCVKSDEECLAAIMKETNAGLAATNEEEIRNFILEKYREWKTFGFTRQKVSGQERFCRQMTHRPGNFITTIRNKGKV